MLRGHQGSQWRGTYDLCFDHHVDRQHLKQSATMSCIICRSLLTELSRLEEKNRRGLIAKLWVDLCRTFGVECLRLKQLGSDEQRRFISGYLSELYGTGQPGAYRLDFRLEDKKRVGTFVLQRVDVKAEDSERAESVASHQTGEQTMHFRMRKVTLNARRSSHEFVAHSIFI